MKILSMTATFGKLERKTLQLHDGLNVRTAPNEWGKSTWCAFLCAMLYGFDLREPAGQDGLADHEKYLPWSGRPMEGILRVIRAFKRVSIVFKFSFSSIPFVNNISYLLFKSAII